MRACAANRARQDKESFGRAVTSPVLELYLCPLTAAERCHFFAERFQNASRDNMFRNPKLIGYWRELNHAIGSRY